MMPKLSGFEVCQKLKSDPDDQADHDPHGHRAQRARRHGAGRRGRAPTTSCPSRSTRKSLVKRVENMLKLRNVTDELERLRRYIEEMEAER